MTTGESLIRSAWNALRARTRDYRSRFAFFGRTSAGVHVTHERALQNATCWACIDVIASSLSSTDWNVYSGTRGADRKTALPDDGLHYVLNSRYNREMTAQSGKRAQMIAAVGYGNGIAEIERDRADRIIGLWPLEPDRVEPRRYEDTGELFYRVFSTRTGGFVDLEPWEVFHIRGAGLTGFVGDDPIGRAVHSIAQSIAIDQFASAYFANNAQPGVVLRVPNLKRMPDPEFNRLKEQWEAGYASRRSFKTGFIDIGTEISKLEVDAEKAQLVDAKHVSVEEICRWFRVPPHKVAHLLRATNNNIEHQGLEFSRDTIRPWKVEIEQECDWSLIPARGPKKFVELDVDWMEQGDYKSRMEAYQIARAMGVFNTNDILRKLGENTIGAEGDVRTMNGAAVRLEDVGKNMTPAQPQKPPPATADLMRSWATSVYQRIQRRIENRRADLERSGRPDAEKLAQRDAMRAMDQALDEILPALCAAWPEARLCLQFGALAVIRGADPERAAADLMDTLQKRNAS